ncbi:MAG TPA: nucleoside-diphosphate kinase [Actinomycetota bacterium]|nr:nucleoside-diphosphate kinase [Actinomycetota bacterium]
MPDEETLVIVKPDAVKRGLVGEILTRLQRKSLRIAEMRLMRVDRDLAERLYAEHREKAFFPELVEFITSGDVVVARVTGESAVPVVRTLMGATDPVEAAPGTIRGDFGLAITQNLVHGSDSPESAKRELDLFFA